MDEPPTSPLVDVRRPPSPREHVSAATIRAISSPASVGLSPTSTPAAASASIFPWAVPLPPDTIAPAWPIFLPAGAVTPAMYALIGLVTWAEMNSAASSSAEPPISPIMNTAWVSGSASNSARQSTKLVPGTGSPPMPTHVDTPMPFSLSSYSAW